MTRAVLESPRERTRLTGLSLIELAVVLAILGVLAAIVVPSVAGFFGTSQSQQEQADQGALQVAVDSFRTDSKNIGSRYPTLANFFGGTGTTTAVGDTNGTDDCEGGNGIGAPGEVCNSYINIAALVSGVTISGGAIPAGFLNGTDAVKSADTSKNTTATNSPSGLVGWYVDAKGKVQAEKGGSPPPPPPPPPAPPPPPLPPGPTLVATVAVPAPPRLMAVNSMTHRVYVAVGNGFDSSTFFVSVIDGPTNTVNIAVPDFSTGPIYVATNDATNRVYVNHTGAYFAQAINGSTNTVIGNVTTGAYPEGIGTNPLTDRLYIANTNSSSVSVINTAGDANSVVTTIPLGNSPVSNLYLAVLPALNRVFVTVSVSNQVKIIDGVTNTVVQTVQLSGAPRLIAANPVTNRLYMALEGTPGEVLVMDGTNGSVIATIPIGGGAAQDVAVSPALNRVYVTSSGSSALTVIDGATNTVATTVDLPATAVRVAADASNGIVYVGAATSQVWILLDP